MRRRAFISLLGGAGLASPLAVRAQQAAMPSIGYLTSLPRDADAPRLAAFRRGLNEMGYVEGQNVAIEYRSAESQSGRLPALAAELVQRRVSVIATLGGYPAALAAKTATATIPIVFQIGADPVGAGLVASLNRPGGNLTGITNINPEILPKRFQLLCELVPSAAIIGWMWNPDDIQNIVGVIEAAGRTAGRQVVAVKAATESEIDRAFEALVQQRAGALLVGPNPFFNARTPQIVTLAAQHRIATSHEFAESVRAGGLMSYGSSITDQCRQVGGYVGRILNGAKSADLPVLQPTRFELVINLKTAKALGLTVPDTLLARADEVIE
jgi:putative ABC transport system substrate-binding protein